MALDWTEFDKDDHSTLCAYVVCRHGRATPLLWKTGKKNAIKDQQKAYENPLVEPLHALVPPAVLIPLLANRGFGDQKLYALLEALGWDVIIRFRGGISVEAEGQCRPASAWVPASGCTRMLSGARVTADKAAVPAVVVVHDRKRKEPWWLATTLTSRTASEIVKGYGRRFRIEETFRDPKDLHFGMDLSATHIRSADRRDRLLFVVALALSLLTLLRAASEAAGFGNHFGKKGKRSASTRSFVKAGIGTKRCRIAQTSGARRCSNTSTRCCASNPLRS